MKRKENEKVDNYLDLARELKRKDSEDMSNSNTNCNWCILDGPQKSEKIQEEFINRERIETI